jgi:periplasmic divalent cation tolerance protein
MPDTQIVVVMMTAPSVAVAEPIVRDVVGERLAACGNIVPGVVSIYRWQNAVERDDEVMVLFKTTRAAAGRLIARIEELHPYDVPEALMLPVEAGSPPYVAWVAGNTG